MPQATSRFRVTLHAARRYCERVLAIVPPRKIGAMKSYREQAAAAIRKSEIAPNMVLHWLKHKRTTREKNRDPYRRPVFWYLRDKNAVFVTVATAAGVFRVETVLTVEPERLEAARQAAKAFGKAESMAAKFLNAIEKSKPTDVTQLRQWCLEAIAKVEEYRKSNTPQAEASQRERESWNKARVVLGRYTNVLGQTISELRNPSAIRRLQGGTDGQPTTQAG